MATSSADAVGEGVAEFPQLIRTGVPHGQRPSRHRARGWIGREPMVWKPMNEQAQARTPPTEGGARKDRIVPDWLGGLAVAVAAALAVAVLYFTYA